jgi:hypothetical protein
LSPLAVCGKAGVEVILQKILSVFVQRQKGVVRMDHAMSRRATGIVGEAGGQRIGGRAAECARVDDRPGARVVMACQPVKKRDLRGDEHPLRQKHMDGHGKLA